jgi:hypothetical protein
MNVSCQSQRADTPEPQSLSVDMLDMSDLQDSLVDTTIQGFVKRDEASVSQDMATKTEIDTTQIESDKEINQTQPQQVDPYLEDDDIEFYDPLGVAKFSI